MASLHQHDQSFAQFLDADVNAQAELGVVLEQRVGPCRPEAFLVGAVGRRGSRSAVDRRATRRVGDHHAVAEELRDRLDVRRFAAAGARSGELEQRPGELAVLDGFRFVDHGILVADLVGACIPSAWPRPCRAGLSSGFISESLRRAPGRRPRSCRNPYSRAARPVMRELIFLRTLLTPGSASVPAGAAAASSCGQQERTDARHAGRRTRIGCTGYSSRTAIRERSPRYRASRIATCRRPTYRPHGRRTR